MPPYLLPPFTPQFPHAAGCSRQHGRARARLPCCLAGSALVESGFPSAKPQQLALDQSRNLTRKLGCPTTPAASALACLRSKTAKELVTAEGAGGDPFVVLGWCPSIDAQQDPSGQCRRTTLPPSAPQKKVAQVHFRVLEGPGRGLLVREN